LTKNTNNLRNILAINIRNHRARIKISQEKLAEICGLHRTFIGSIERAEGNVTLSTLEAIAKGLKITVPDLLGDKSDNHFEE